VDFWHRYLDHALKGVDFMRMVADGSLREEEYMVVMRKNAEHIGSFVTGRAT